MSVNRPYRLQISGKMRRRLEVLVRCSAAVGIDARTSAALLTIEDKLSTDPVGWGDPLWRFRAAELTAYLRLYDELAVVYAVHETEPYVWLTRIVPVFRHPLSGLDPPA